jgi:hypothetical protein
MGLIKASSLRIDLSVGKYNSGFTDLISGPINQSALVFDFSLIDTLAEGLQAQKVRYIKLLFCYNTVRQSALEEDWTTSLKYDAVYDLQDM